MLSTSLHVLKRGDVQILAFFCTSFHDEQEILTEEEKEKGWEVSVNSLLRKRGTHGQLGEVGVG